MNSPGGYVYVLFGEDAFGRDEAVQTLKDRMRSLPAGEHNMTELSADTNIAELRKATDVVPFLAERRMVIVRGLLSRLSGRGGGQRRGGRSRKPADTGVDVRQLVVGRDVAIWSLLDGLAERRADKALAALHALYAQGEPPEALLGRDIAPHYRRLMVARELSLASKEERARVDVTALGLNPATVGRWTDQAAGFERQDLEQALSVLLDLDRKIKTGETEPEPAPEVA